MELWIVKQCRRAALQQLFLYAGALVFLFFICLASNPYFAFTHLIKTVHLTAADVDGLRFSDPLPVNRMRVAIAELVETGVGEVLVTKENGRTVREESKALYYVLNGKEKSLLVKAPMPPSERFMERPLFPKKEEEGTLKPLPDSLRKAIAARRERVAMSERLQPYYLDAVTPPFVYFDPLPMLSLSSVTALICLYWPWSYKRYRNPHLSEVFLRIFKWGYPIEMSRAIEEELEASVRYRLRGAVITDTYLVAQKFAFFDVRRMDDLLWAYERVVWEWFLFIPIGKRYEIRFAFVDRQLYFVDSHERIQEVLQGVAERMPWVFLGYLKVLKWGYAKHRGAMVLLVSWRRERLNQMTTPLSNAVEHKDD
jgi:hypothetical protein